MRIAFVGLPLAALLLARDGHEIVWAGICRRDAIGVRRLARTIGRSRVMMVPDLSSSRHLQAIRGSEPDLLVSWFWTRNVPQDVRTIAPLGAFGVHPSLLPRHRGPDPTFWAIESGDHETGVTAHLLDDEYDTGAILGQKKIAIDPTWSSWHLAKKLDRPSLALLREVVRAYADGNPPKPRAQDESKATDAPSPEDDLLEIRWRDATAAEIERRVRAASPWPGAFTDIGGETLTLVKVKTTDDVPSAIDPGEAFVRKDGVTVVRAKKGGVELHRARRDDEDDVEIDAAEIARLVKSHVH